MCANRKLHSSMLFERPGPSYTPHHMMAESRPLHLLLRLIRAPLRLQRRYHADPLLAGLRLHMCANRKLHSSMLFERPGPSYTPHHMMAESRPLHLLLRLIRVPLRLQRRYHADPLLTGAAIVVYICVPIANYTVACCLNDQGLPTHPTICWRRVDLCTSCFASSECLFDYSD